MKKVTVYSTPTCPYCQKVKEYLKEKGVDYTEVNVAEDTDRQQEMIEKSGQMGVPVIIIGDEVIVGFDEKKIDRAIG